MAAPSEQHGVESKTGDFETPKGARTKNASLVGSPANCEGEWWKEKVNLLDIMVNSWNGIIAHNILPSAKDRLCQRFFCTFAHDLTFKCTNCSKAIGDYLCSRRESTGARTPLQYTPRGGGDIHWGVAYPSGGSGWLWSSLAWWPVGGR